MILSIYQLRIGINQLILVIKNALFVKYNTVKSALKKILKEDNGRYR